MKNKKKKKKRKTGGEGGGREGGSGRRRRGETVVYVIFTDGDVKNYQVKSSRVIAATALKDIL